MSNEIVSYLVVSLLTSVSNSGEVTTIPHNVLETVAQCEALIPELSKTKFDDSSSQTKVECREFVICEDEGIADCIVHASVYGRPGSTGWYISINDETFRLDDASTK